MSGQGNGSPGGRPRWQCGGDEDCSTGRSEVSGPHFSRTAGRAGAFFAGGWAGNRIRTPFILPILHHGASSDDLNVIGRANSEHDAAATIAMGAAEVSPGARSAATEAGLAFVSIGWEAFDFALYRGIFFRTLFQRLLDELKTPATHDLARALGGYDLSEVGKLVWASQG